MSLELQQALFENKVTRRWLLDYTPISTEVFKVQVFRNHSFELIEHTLPAYLDYANLRVNFSYSGYDDSFSFMELDESVDMILVWIDLNRYKEGDIASYIKARVKELRKRYKGHILVAPLGGQLGIQEPGVVEYSFDGVRKQLGDKFLDEKNLAMTGTPLSNKSMMMVAKELGLRYIPSIIKSPLKAIVVDLDNTLYKGVLGEDGIEGVELTDGHINLQQFLKKKSEEGFFLCISSKNELEDVKRMFAERKDFPLSLSDFTRVEVSWNAKASSIDEIAKFLNIGMDSILFIDDNIGELYSVQSNFPSIHLIHALDDAGLTTDILMNYPGITKFTNTQEDAFRKNDAIANEYRQKMQEQLSPDEYIKSLELKLEYFVNNKEQIERISQLSNKTNQFIFNYMRYSEQDIYDRMADDKYAVISVALSDKLSDSGLICVCVGEKEENVVIIEECFMSCRALGRGIDDIIINVAISEVVKKLGCKNIHICFQKGARNLPAEKYIDKYLAMYKNTTSTFEYNLVNPNVTIINNR